MSTIYKKKNKRDLSTVCNDQGKEFDKNKLTNFDSITVKRNQLLDDKKSKTIYIGFELDENAILRFIITL